jgi:hypothetical protein
VHDGRDAHTCDDETGLEAAAFKWMSDRESYVIAKLICTFFFPPRYDNTRLTPKYPLRCSGFKAGFCPLCECVSVHWAAQLLLHTRMSNSSSHVRGQDCARRPCFAVEQLVLVKR